MNRSPNTKHREGNAMSAAPSALEQSLAEAIADYNAGRLERSENLCRALLRQYAGNPALLQLLGVLLLKRGQFSEARTCIEHCLSARPDHPASLLVAGQIERAAGDLRSAARYFARGADLAPHATEPSCLLGSVLTELGDATAVPVLRGVVTKFPGHAEAWCQLGAALKSAGALEQSLAAFEHALALAPNLARAEAARGALLHALGRLEHAVLALRRAQQLEPDSALIAHDLGIALHQARELDAAGTAQERAVTLDAVFAQAWFRLGLV